MNVPLHLPAMCDHSTESKHLPPPFNISVTTLVATIPRIHFFHLQDPDRLRYQEITICTLIDITTPSPPA